MTTRAEEIAGPYKASGNNAIHLPGGQIIIIQHTSERNEILKLLNAAYKQGQQDRWIPLSERYPERGSRFVLWDARKKQASPGIFTHDMDEVNWTEKYGFTHWYDYPSPPNPERP